jgi:glutaconate CoA-transferase subunit B
VLVYESGAIGARPQRLPLSIGDDDLAAGAQDLVSVPEMFNYWIGGGRIDVGFPRRAQIDRFGNINTTVIGDYAHPKVRLPGAGGAPEIARSAGRIIVLLRHSPRSFVGELDFITSVGRDLDGPSNGAPGSAVITDLGILRPRRRTASSSSSPCTRASSRRRPRGHGLAAARPRAAGGHRAGDRARALRAARAAGVGRRRVSLLDH